VSRARNIKPGYFKNDVLAECSPLARILFAGLWCEADREGRLEDRPKKIKAECLPYDDCDIDELLGQLVARGFILRYVVDGKGYIAVCEFAKHQNPHCKEQASSIPAPDQHCASTVQAQNKTGTSTEVAGLIPDSGYLIPDPLIPAVPAVVAVVVSAYHDLLPNCQRAEVINPKREKRIKTADKLAQSVCSQQGWPYDRDAFWRSYFGECAMDPWMRGEVPNPKNPRWRQNLDVLLAEDRFASVMDAAISAMKDSP
jgi:hypothetical protein